MGHIPVRDSAGRIVDVVDAREVAAAAEDEEAQAPEERAEPEEGASTSPPLAPDAQRPMEEVLRGVRKSANSSERASWRNSAAEATIGVLVALTMVALLLGRPLHAPAEPPATGTSMSAATSAAQPATAITSATADSGQLQLARAVVAYAAPDGPVVGALEPGREYTPTGRLDTAWLQLEAAQSGLVWVRTAELEASTDVIARLPDLATPTPAPAPIPLPALVVAPPAPVARNSPPFRCTPARVVAIVSDGVTDVWSCVSLADALSTLPDGKVIAADPAAAQAYLATFYEQQTAIAPLTQP